MRTKLAMSSVYYADPMLASGDLMSGESIGITLTNIPANTTIVCNIDEYVYESGDTLDN